MKAKERATWVSGFLTGLLTLALVPNALGQTQLNLATQGRNVDFTNAPFTKPIRMGGTLPANCSPGEFFLNTGAVAGQNLFACLSSSWTLMAAQNGVPNPGSMGLLMITGPSSTTTVHSPAGTIVGTTDVQTLTGKSIDASEVNSGIFNASRMPALAGDVTSPSGSTATALATVLNTPGTFGDATHAVQLTVDGKGRVTSLNTLPIVSGPTSVFYQQLSKAGAALTQRSTLNLSGAFAISDNQSATRTDLDLAPVNATPGTFGSAGQVPVLTVNAYGQVTSITTAASASANSASQPSTVTTMSSGNLSTLPASCSAGNLFYASDQPAGQQIYTCNSGGSWSQFISIGGSGALAFNNGSLDIVTSVVPRLTAANTFGGSNTFANGITLASSGQQPSCTSTSRGLIWYQNNGASKDGLQVCAYSGSTYTWVTLY